MMKTAQTSEVSKFLKVFMPFILVFIGCDLLIGSLLEYHYKRIKQGFYYETTYAIEHTKAPYLVFGSSRACHHYNSQIFSKAFSAPFYNCGRDAQEIIYSAAVISAVLDRYTPKAVIIDVLPNEFSIANEGKLGALLPYYENKSIRPFLKYNSRFEEVKMLSGMYRYNSQLGNILASRTIKKMVDTNQKGYLPRWGSLPNQPPDRMDEERGKVVDTAKLKVFREILQRLEQRKIKTIVVISPLYKQYIPGLTVKTCKELTTGRKGISFINYTNDPKYHHSDLFYDDYHLNDHGATLFSTELARLIKAL